MLVAHLHMACEFISISSLGSFLSLLHRPCLQPEWSPCTIFYHFLLPPTHHASGPLHLLLLLLSMLLLQAQLPSSPSSLFVFVFETRFPCVTALLFWNSLCRLVLQLKACTTTSSSIYQGWVRGHQCQPKRESLSKSASGCQRFLCLL